MGSSCRGFFVFGLVGWWVRPLRDTPRMTSNAASPTRTPTPFQRWGRRLLIATAAVLALWLFGWLGVPQLLKWQLQWASKF